MDKRALAPIKRGAGVMMMKSLWCAVVWMGFVAGAQAQIAQAPDFAAKVNDPDGMATRTLACTTCHGAQGKATQNGYFPRIAGKPAGYLYNQLLNLRDGRRHYPTMGYLLENLTDDYLREMAVHFASLDIPYPEPLVAKDIHALAKELKALGYHITIETAATVKPEGIACDLASLSPKLLNSAPEHMPEPPAPAA